MYERYEKMKADKGVTNADVSRATGITESTLSNWKKRGGNISIDNAAKLAKYFGITVDALIAE